MKPVTITSTEGPVRERGQRLGVLSLLHAILSVGPIGAWRARRETRRAVQAAEAAAAGTAVPSAVRSVVLRRKPKPAKRPTEYRNWCGYLGLDAVVNGKRKPGQRVNTGPASIATGWRCRTHSTKAVR